MQGRSSRGSGFYFGIRIDYIRENIPYLSTRTKTRLQRDTSLPRTLTLEFSGEKATAEPRLIPKSIRPFMLGDSIPLLRSVVRISDMGFAEGNLEETPTKRKKTLKPGPSRMVKDSNDYICSSNFWQNASRTQRNERKALRMALFNPRIIKLLS